MPLAFRSQSHGTIAFGFFNIESDMLLLDRYFFFATDFCDTVCKLSQALNESGREFPCPAFFIEDPAGIGDLHGGIAGTHYSGFIGETYKKYPFPRDPAGFRQQTRGFETRHEFEQMMRGFGTRSELCFQQDIDAGQFVIGPYVFTSENYFQLIEYVIQGGYPRWLDNVAPDYVIKMRDELAVVKYPA